MKVRHVRSHGAEGDKLRMTPMIDVVFLLLVFFIMTFKIVAPEGDFPIKMPRAAPSPGPEPESPPITITMRADPQTGRLAGMQFGAVDLGTDFDALRIKAREIAGDDAGPGSLNGLPEVTFKCDYDLHYRYTMAAVTAVTGYVNRRKETVKLFDKIRFAPPSTRPAG